MWNEIIDAKGHVRGTMFYKAAFYDRSAHMSLNSRYRVHSEYIGEDSRTVEVYFGNAQEKIMVAGQVYLKRYATPEEKKEILDLLGYAEECQLEENKILHEFSDKAWRCAFFRETLERNARRALGNTLLYFEQEGLLDGDFALCDSGWAGTMQDCLQAILGSTGKEIRVYGFYFGLFTGSAAGDCKNTFYFGPDGGLRKKLKFNNNLLETLLVSPDPLTVGYSESGCAVVPVFRRAGDDWFAEDHALLQEWLRSERKRRLISSGRKFSRRIKRVM